MKSRSATFGVGFGGVLADQGDRDAEDIQDLVALGAPALQEVQLAVAQADILPFDGAAAQESRLARRAAIIAAPFAFDALEVAVADENRGC